MKQNISLWLALRFVQLFFGLASLTFLFFIIGMIAGLLELPLADKILISKAGDASTRLGITLCLGGDCADSLDLLSSFAYEMKWWILFRGSLLFIFKILIIWQVVALLKAIIYSKTFYKENIKAFERMVRYGLIIALIGSFNFRYLDKLFDGPYFGWQIDIPFSTLLFTLGCKVLVEIFKQGKLLSEENQSFV